VDRRWSSRLVERGWLVAAAALVGYAALASPYIVDGDNAELATLGALGGRAHPSGYPLYVLWLRAWSWLPGASPAHTAALATALLGGLTIGVLHAACRAWGARPLAVTVSVAMFAAAPVVLRFHCEAEVFAMNNLVAALVLWLAAARGPLHGRWQCAALGLVAGLGLANHLTCALIAPIGIYGVVRAGRGARLAGFGLAIAGLAIGLVPYAYLVVADGPASWGQVDAPSDLLAIILRTEYGGATSFMPGAALPWLANVVACAATLARSWLWLPAAGGAAMLGARIWRPAGESRAAWLVLAISVVVTGPLLASRFNVDPHGVGLYVCQRFHILPALLLAVPVAAALDVAGAWLTGVRARRRAAAGDPGPPVPALAAGALVVVGLAALVATSLPRLARVQSPAMQRGVENLLRALPPGAIVVVNADDQCFGGRYAQLALGERPDVALVCGGLLPTRWYRAAWARRGIEMPPSVRARLGDALLATGRPVFASPDLPELVAGFPHVPLGVVYRVLPRGAQPPPASEVAAINRDAYRAFELDYSFPGPDDDYATLAHHRYAASWAVIAQLLDAAGDRPAARDAFALTEQLRPRAQ